jgi:hypothetical protein
MFQISQIHCLEFTNGTYLILTTVPPLKFHKTVYALHFILHFIVSMQVNKKSNLKKYCIILKSCFSGQLF